MSTVARTTRTQTYGPERHGQRMSYEEFASAPWQEGYRYELIDGRIEVAPAADLDQDSSNSWLYRRLDRYADKHPEIINYVTMKPRVFIPARPDVTCPEPDLAAYKDFPLKLPFTQRDWRDLSPFLVAEVLSLDAPNKDLVRNVELYRLVPSIAEYWIVDPRVDPDKPGLIVYRRRGQNWQKPIRVAFGETYVTRHLPGFDLVMNPYLR
ncbi:MAG TPA: Uma2 family endonuclease [Gemmataceae bacterium]|jgi:Uma2 family endonuclease|nr:Uma2 family endonuclease [Gemmataceae bacterium]